MLAVPGADVVVVTDDPRIARSAEAVGAASFVSQRHAESGSDRIRNYLEESHRFWPEILVSVQADEPLLEPEAVSGLIHLLATNPRVRVATLLRALASPREPDDRNVVKAAFLPDGRVETFARELAGPRRDGWYAHVGVYAFHAEAFRAFTDLPPSRRERQEGLEQLRMLENGIAIHGLLFPTRSIGVDTPADLERVRAMLREA